LKRKEKKKKKLKEERIEFKRLNSRDFFSSVPSDIVMMILRYLERNEILKLKVSNSFVEYVKEVLLSYPPVPYFVEYDIVNENYSSNKMIRWDISEKDNSSSVTHWMIEVIPNYNIWQRKRIYVPYNQNSYVVILANYGSYNINVIAKNMKCASRSKTKTVHYCQPIQPIQYLPYIEPQKSDSFKGCFEGRALIKMADLTKKFAKDIVVGDVVMGGDGKGYNVKKVMSNTEKSEKQMVNLSNFWITRGHPILQNGDWYRPDELSKSQPMILEHGLINFLLEGNEHTVIVGGQDEKSKYGKDKNEIICCTLGKYCGPRLAALYPHHNKLFHLDYLNPTKPEVASL
jgi:hypothetical protein